MLPNKDRGSQGKMADGIDFPPLNFLLDSLSASSRRLMVDVPEPVLFPLPCEDYILCEHLLPDPCLLNSLGLGLKASNIILI